MSEEEKSDGLPEGSVVFSEMTEELCEDLKLICDADEASSELKKGMFPRIVALCAFNSRAGKSYEDTLIELQAKIKEKVGSVPTVFRTTKSVILNAVNYNVSLYDKVTWQPKGKSAIEKEIKHNKQVAQSLAVLNTTDRDVIHDAVQHLTKAYIMLTGCKGISPVVMVQLQDLRDSLNGLQGQA